MLDAGVLGRLCHPRKHADVKAWATRVLVDGAGADEFVVPEIADYELRRELHHLRFVFSIEQLDAMCERMTYLPVTTAAMRLAAELWGAARRGGFPTAGDGDLDADVILAAQARLADAIVVTENVRHLERYVTALRWTDVTPRSPR